MKAVAVPMTEIWGCYLVAEYETPPVYSAQALDVAFIATLLLADRQLACELSKAVQWCIAMFAAS